MIILSFSLIWVLVYMADSNSALYQCQENIPENHMYKSIKQKYVYAALCFKLYTRQLENTWTWKLFTQLGLNLIFSNSDIITSNILHILHEATNNHQFGNQHSLTEFVVRKPICFSSSWRRSILLLQLSIFI